MPAFFTHYLFGRMGYGHMEEGVLKQAVRRHKKAYALGLSGPDIFFYFVPDQLLREKPGTVMHERACGAFLRHMLKEVLELEGEERRIGAAYLAGFVGHYELDSYCHPHVYQHIGQAARAGASAHERTGIHFCYECAMDYYFLKHYTNRTPSMLNQNKIVRLNRQERNVICRLVAAAYNRTYPYPNLSRASMQLVLASLRAVMCLIRDRKGRREKIALPIERLLYGYPFLTGLFVNDNCYGVGIEEWEIMDSLFRKALEDYDGVIKALGAVLEEGQGLEASRRLEAQEKGSRAMRRRKKEFYDKLGSRSYHTGQPV